MFLRRERLLKPVPLLENRRMRREARKALDQIGIDIPFLNVPVAREGAMILDLIARVKKRDASRSS
jgi:hypothetical protein